MAVQFAKPALDRLLSEVMTGFGAIPRRGAEVGGILVGRAEAGTIWVDEVVVTPCEHRRGPSFLLSESDTAKFDEAFANAAAAGGPAAPVGLFRSNTRDHDELGDEDRALYAKTFLSGDGVFLVIRPFATKPPTGSFLFGLDAKLPQTASEVFEFGRGEQPSSAQPRRRMTPEPAVGSGSAAVPVKVRVPLPRPAPVAPVEPEPVSEYRLSAPDATVSYEPAATAEARTWRRNWLWIPVSFIFLVLGVLLGFQSALTFYPRAAKVDASALGLGLSVVRRADNLHIRWNREALAIRSAQRGTLVIEDGAYKKAVDLDPSALQNGSVIYPPNSANVNLRFEVVVTGGTQITESLGWSKQE